jgi:hypothetical protein
MLKVDVDGRVAEWLKAAAFQAARARKGLRRFESYPFRHRAGEREELHAFLPIEFGIS